MLSKLFKALLALSVVLMVNIKADSKEVYSSKTYEISIERRCEEGYVSCDNVFLEARNKKSGEILRLLGSTHHTRCADGVSPCKFLGYVFNKHGLKIFIDQQNIVLTKNGVQVLREQLK